VIENKTKVTSKHHMVLGQAASDKGADRSIKY